MNLMIPFRRAYLEQLVEPGEESFIHPLYKTTLPIIVCINGKISSNFSTKKK